MKGHFIWYLFFIWCLFFGSLTLWRVIFLPDQPTILALMKPMPITDSFLTYTKAFDCKCDVLITCQGSNLINTTVSDFYYKTTNNSEWCG